MNFALHEIWHARKWPYWTPRLRRAAFYAIEGQKLQPRPAGGQGVGERGHMTLSIIIHVRGHRALSPLQTDSTRTVFVPSTCHPSLTSRHIFWPCIEPFGQALLHDRTSNTSLTFTMSTSARRRLMRDFKVRGMHHDPASWRAELHISTMSLNSANVRSANANRSSSWCFRLSHRR
jgi:hypothetical protein